MNTGTISDIDVHGGFGLIDADDGQIVCFHRRNLALQDLGKLDADALSVGARVAFSVDSPSQTNHVTAVTLCAARNNDN